MVGFIIPLLNAGIDNLTAFIADVINLNGSRFLDLLLISDTLLLNSLTGFEFLAKLLINVL